MLRRLNGKQAQEIDVALDELGRIEHILERLLLLGRSKQPDFVVLSDLEVGPFSRMCYALVRGGPRGWSGVCRAAR